MVAVTRAFAPVLATIALLGMVVGWAPGAVAADGPQFTLSTSQVAAGETVRVIGKDWPRGKEVTVSVCQDPGGGRTLTCAPASRQGVPVSWDGYFTTELRVDIPEGGCPCVVAVDSPSGPPVTRAVRITDATGRSVTAPTGLVVEEARLVGGQGPGAWFGGAARPDLELEVHNGGETSAELTVRVQWRDGLEDAVTVPVSPVSALGPGETRTVVIPLTFQSFSQGGHTVEGTILTEETIVPFKATTTVVPWGLYAVVVVGLASAAGWRNRWLFAPQPTRSAASPAPVTELDEDLEARALSLLDHHSATTQSTPRVPRQPAREPAKEPAAGRSSRGTERETGREGTRETAWAPMDPAEVIERSTPSSPSVPRQRREGGRRADRSSRLTGGIRRR